MSLSVQPSVDDLVRVCVLTLEPAEDRADVMAFSPDGTRLLTGSERGSAIVWDVRRGQGPSRPKE
jgi:WD40 repeat protein